LLYWFVDYGNLLDGFVGLNGEVVRGKVVAGEANDDN
jgi:hypothetical protein